MRGTVAPFADRSQLADLTPNEATFALTVQESPFKQIEAIGQKLNLENNNDIKNPVELNEMFPNVDEKFTLPESAASAAFKDERARIKNHFKQQISYAPNTLGAKTALFTSSVVGSLIDPIGNLGMLAAGPAMKAAGLVGKTLGQRIGYNIAENFLSNMVVDATAGIAAKQVGDEFDPAQRVGMNLGASVLFGIPGGFAEHYFRQAPQLGKKMADLAEARGRSGLDPEGAKEIFNAVIAAENSGDHFPYSGGPFDQSKPFYSGSRHFTEDWASASHAVREDIGHERGVQLFDNENTAHAGALTVDSGSAGSVFTHDLSGKNIVDGNLKLSELGYPEAVNVTERALERHNVRGNVHAGTDIDTLVHALEAHKTGHFAVESLEKLHGELHDTLLGKTLNDVGLFKAYKSFEDFARIADMRKNEIPYYSIKDIILLMDKEIRASTGGVRKKLTAKYADFIGSLRGDMETSLINSGNPDIVGSFKSLTKDMPHVTKYGDISVHQAYKEILRAYHEGSLSLADVVQFEHSIGGDGISFSMDHFRGHNQTPTNGVYIFDRNSMTPAGVKQAEIKAVGGMTPDRMKSIEMHINGEGRIFEQKPNKKGELIWKEVEARAIAPDTQLGDTAMEAKLNDSFSETQLELKAIEGFEGHLSAEEVAAVEHAKEQFGMAAKVEGMYAKIKACLR